MEFSCTKERFLRDVVKHTMTVFKDDGVYRHLRFSKDGTACMYFDLITWPGYLCITGDMGEAVFSRVNDMFTFFRHKNELSINPGYWGEKCKAGEIKAFDSDTFDESVKSWCEDTIEQEELNTEDADILREDIEKLIGISDEWEAVEAIRGFRSSKGYEFDLSEGFKMEEYRFHFIWRLYAIVWGISEYDKQKQ